MHGSCPIAPQPTRVCRMSYGDLARLPVSSSGQLPAAGLQQWKRWTWLMRSSVTGLRCQWLELLTCPGWAGGRSASTTVWRQQYIQTVQTVQQLCYQHAWWGEAGCHRHMGGNWKRTPWLAMTSATGLQYAANSSGPSTDPWGTLTCRSTAGDWCRHFNKLRPAGEVRAEPGEWGSRNPELRLQALKEYEMFDRVKSCQQIQTD